MAELSVRQRFALALGLPFGDLHLEEYDLWTREALLYWVRLQLAKTDERAYHLAHIVAVVRTALREGILIEDDAWQIMLVAAKLAQQSYRTWEELAASYLRGRKTPQDLDAARAVWAELPWTTDLEVILVDPTQQTRVLSASCSACGAGRTRPSPSAYVYCHRRSGCSHVPS